MKAEKRVLASFCAECEGRCCRGHQIILSGEEYRRLKKKPLFKEGFIDSPTGCRIMTLDALDKCPFLGKEGCILSELERPLVCRLYPLTPVIEKDKLCFYLSSLCPFHKESMSLKQWLRSSIQSAEKELCLWDRKESIFLCRRRRKKGEELLALDL